MKKSKNNNMDKLLRKVNIVEEIDALPNKAVKKEAFLVYKKLQEYIRRGTDSPSYAESSSEMVNVPIILDFFKEKNPDERRFPEMEKTLGLIHLQFAFLLVVRLLELKSTEEEISSIIDVENGERLMDFLKKDLDAMYSTGVFR